VLPRRALRTPQEVTLPNLRLYRAVLILAAALMVVALFTLSSPDAPPLSQEPVTFDGQAAFDTVHTLTTQFSRRAAASDASNRCAVWLAGQLTHLGLQTHIDSFAATINGKAVALQNVWGASKGQGGGAIVLVANRDSPPLSTQGSNNNASGVAVLLELARDFAATPHQRTIVFLFTDGDSWGGLGARDFVHGSLPPDTAGAIALRDVGVARATGLSLDGWSASAKVAPPWLWLLTTSAAQSAGNLQARLPGTAAQVLRLAVPSSAGSQGPFVVAGVPALTVSAIGHTPAPAVDVIEAISPDTLSRVGATVQRLVASIDTAPDNLARSGGTIFVTRNRTLPGGALELILAALLLPLAAVAGDLFAQGRRRRVPLWPGWLRYTMHLAPWLLLCVIVYLANLLSLLPHTPGAVTPPDSSVSHHPWYLRVALLLVVLLVAYYYAAAIERRLARRYPVNPRAAIFVAHAALVLIGFFAFLVNPFSLLLLIPAAILWPLARPGRWVRSVLPVWLGLVSVAVAFVFYALRLHLGATVWWYFFVLFENRTIPVSAALLGAAFLAATGMLGSTLHRTTMAPPAAEGGAAATAGSSDAAASAGKEKGEPPAATRP
jgi:hypothetical protein